MPSQSEPAQAVVAFDARKIRSDFPALQVEIHGKPLVYLDNAATSQKPNAVIDRLTRYYREENANVHRGVHTLSQVATSAYEGVRETVRAFIGAARTEEIVFTKGTTESINLVASCFARQELKPGDEILISGMEHHSNIVPWQLAAERSGARLVVVPVDDQGNLVYEEYERLLSERTRIVAIVHASNSLGTINPIARMISDAHAFNVPVLVDGAQAIPHGRVDVAALGADFYAFSAHKAFGPTGCGVLYGRSEWLNRLPPWQGGGDMIESVSFDGTRYNDIPHKFEAGTPNIAGVIGMGAAFEYLDSIDLTAAAAHEADLLAYAWERLETIPDIRFIGSAERRVAVVSFLVGDLHPYDVATVIDRYGVAVRTGHHCTQPLMTRFGIPGTIRASFAFYNLREDVDRLFEAVEAARRFFV